MLDAEFVIGCALLFGSDMAGSNELLLVVERKLLASKLSVALI